MSQLSPRERNLILLALLVAVIGGGYRFVWLPTEAGRQSARQEIAAYRQLTAAIDAFDRGAQPVAAPAAVSDVPMATRVTASAQEAAMPIRRLEPEGARLRVTLEEVAFVDVIDWLARLEADYDMRLAAVELDRRPLPGIVSARITLEPAT